jgi:hypothetical protein
MDGGVMDIVKFIRARLDDDEWWAREASRPRASAPVPGGVHWQWVDSAGDQVLAIDPVLGELLNDGGRADLRSVEEFPSSVGPLPLFAVSYPEEVPTVVAGHIVRHDPARVLREVAAHRLVLELHDGCGTGVGRCDDGGHSRGMDGEQPGCTDQAALASIWSDHPDYDQAWAVE